MSLYLTDEADCFGTLNAADRSIRFHHVFPPADNVAFSFLAADYQTAVLVTRSSHRAPFGSSSAVARVENKCTREVKHSLGLRIVDAQPKSTIHRTVCYMTQIGMEQKNVAGTVVNGISRPAVNGLIVAFLLHAAKTLKSIGHFGSLVAHVSLKSIRGRHWLYGASPGIYDQPGSLLDNDISFDVSEISEVFYSDPYGLASRILETIYFSSNWGDIVDSPEEIQSLVNEGFNYCHWPISQPPRP